MVVTALVMGCSAGAGSGGATDAQVDDGSTADAAPLAGDGRTGDAATTVSFSADVYPIVSAHCALSGCHDSFNFKNHFQDFSSAASTHARWINGPGYDVCANPGVFNPVQRIVVVPGEPESSYLVEKISSESDEKCWDNDHSWRMPPPPLPRLTTEQIAVFVTWIREGAANN